jgi:site-specific recombinase XerC
MPMTPSNELEAVIADFLAEAEEGTVRDGTGRPYTREAVRELRRSLAHVVSELGTIDAAAVRGRDVRVMVDGLRAAGLPPERVAAVVNALRAVYAYAVGRGLVRTSPVVGLADAEPAQPSPTDAMLELGERLAAWMVRAIVIAFVLVAVGLAFALR